MIKLTQKSNTPKNKKVTIETLAIMVAKGFDSASKEMDERFEKVDKRFDGIDERLDGIDIRLDNMDNRLDRIENNHGRRLDKTEDNIRIIKTTFEKNLKIKLPK